MSVETNASARHERVVVGLLSAAVALLALLVVGLGVGAWLLLRTASRLEAAWAGAGAEARVEQLEAAIARTRALAEELTQRQEAAATGLARVAGETAARINTIERRLKALEPIQRGPFQKLDQMIQLQQLLAAEQVALMQHMVETQEVLALTARPLPTQQQLTRPSREQGTEGEDGKGRE